MKGRILLVAAVTSALCGCSRSADEAAASNAATPIINEAKAAPPPPATGPDARTPLSEPSGPIDPKSVEAAGQVVQSYAALIEQGRWNEAHKLWGSEAAAKAFDANFLQLSAVHLEIGNLGEPEGAAGSIYVTVPVIFYGDLKDGQPYRRAAEVILRRVNDVPGSTEAQRRWHIERIDWAS
jgi:hypothetical protein